MMKIQRSTGCNVFTNLHFVFASLFEILNLNVWRGSGGWLFMMLCNLFSRVAPRFIAYIFKCLVYVLLHCYVIQKTCFGINNLIFI